MSEMPRRIDRGTRQRGREDERVVLRLRRWSGRRGSCVTDRWRGRCFNRGRSDGEFFFTCVLTRRQSLDHAVAAWHWTREDQWRIEGRTPLSPLMRAERSSGGAALAARLRLLHLAIRVRMRRIGMKLARAEFGLRLLGGSRLISVGSGARGRKREVGCSLNGRARRA